MLLIGDIALTGLFTDDPEHNSERFSSLIPLLKNDRLTFANLECPVYIEGAENEYKSFTHTSSEKVYRDLLPKLGLSCVSLANNHIYDCTMHGLKKTISLLDEMKIKHTGAGWKEEHIEPVFLEEDGKKIAFLAYVDKNTNPKTENFPELFINYFELDKVIADLNKIREKVDFIICSIHWGTDYSNFFTKKQETQAKQLIDAGADIIMGHHPHTIQAYEVHKDKHIFYSLGQLCFGDKNWKGNFRALKRKTKLGMIVNYDTTSLKIENIIPTKELKGNYILVPKVNIVKKSSKLLRINRLIFKNTFIKKLMRIKESFIDRTYEYFFGYYRNPLKQLFAFRNFKKITFVIRDYKNSKKNKS